MSSEAKITRLNEKIAALRQEIQRLNQLNSQMMETEDKQISLTDPDARSMATSGRGSGVVGYNVQSAVDTRHHLIVAHVNDPDVAMLFRTFPGDGQDDVGVDGGESDVDHLKLFSWEALA